LNLIYRETQKFAKLNPREILSSHLTKMFTAV